MVYQNEMSQCEKSLSKCRIQILIVLSKNTLKCKIHTSQWWRFLYIAICRSINIQCSRDGAIGWSVWPVIERSLVQIPTRQPSLAGRIRWDSFLTSFTDMSQWDQCAITYQVTDIFSHIILMYRVILFHYYFCLVSIISIKCNTYHV